MTNPIAVPENTAAAALRHKLVTRTARVGVVGLGYVGLPLLVKFARAGFRATGLDLDARKVDALRRGESYIQDVASADVSTFRESGRLQATTNPKDLGDLD